ncbi:MAG TPA: N-methyl-L-tryptophan oxidase [Pseudomonadales bacterium]|nr:N-methyl-L-tryptophan oxidase [Pseudomonadales bacterium]
MSGAYDAIVLGLGAMGSATLDQLARRGARVLGIEQFGIPHDLGSSGGDTRLIRKAYFEHPDYVPLLERAYANWEDLEARAGERVLYRSGVTYIGTPRSASIAGTRAAAAKYGLRCDTLAPRDLAVRAPMLRVPSGCDAVFEPDGGFVLAGRAIRAFCESALRHGADVRAGECALEWRETSHGVEVRVGSQTHRAARLVVTVGSWASRLLPRLPVQLAVTRQTSFWVWPQNAAAYALGAFGCWAAELADLPGLFYGFPLLPAALGGQLGLKIAHHHQGEPATPGRLAPAQAFEFEPVREALRAVFADELGPVVAAKTCMYTSSPDRHFIVDRYPDSERVTIACGFSGHGFKFASVIGEALADIAIEGHTALPIEFLSLRRFAASNATGGVEL